MIDAEMYVSPTLDIIYCFPDAELGRRVEADDLTEEGVAFRRVDAKWFRWLHERVTKAKAAGVETPGWERVMNYIETKHGPAKAKAALMMQLPVGYRAPGVRR